MDDEVKDFFVEKIIKNKIKPPTRLNFSLEKWNKEWVKIEDCASGRDRKVYKAGVIIDSALGDIREKLTELYNSAPKTNYERLMLAYVAISNRTTSVALKLAKRTTVSNIQSILLKSNEQGNKQGVGELFHGAVDGQQLAIKECLRSLENGRKVKLSKEPIEEIEFILRESWLSQLYWTYTHLWQCVLWSDYHLVEVDEGEKIFSIKQPMTPYEVAFMDSANRKERLSGQIAMMATRPNIRAKFLDDKYVVIKRENKKRVASVQPVSDAGDELITWNTQWRITEYELYSHYPESWLNDDYGQGFCLSEILEIMRCLMLMANAAKSKFPEDDSVFNVNKLNEFCPKVRAFSLKRALCDATGLDFKKINHIVDFLTAKSSLKGDLWCQPLIKTSQNEYALMVSALSSPSVFRVFEQWAVEVGIDLSEKGYTYEKTVVDELNYALETNQLVDNYDKGVSKRVKIDSDEEEFDLLARIDDLIIVGEAKSIVTTDSEISKYRTSEILQHAGQQVIRKTGFLKDNLPEVFARLGWTFDKSKDYKFVQFILNSSGIFVGHNFNGIPVIDERILSAYFESSRMNLMSVASKTGTKAIAWYKLYENLEELKANFQIYVSNPPQLNGSEDCYEYNEIGFPYMTSDSFRLSKNYLVLKEKGPLAVMEREHHFQVIKSADYDFESSKIKIAM
ncbi:hypothetical protein ACP7H9_00095 [Idiomarina sp. ST20R2A10]|uniref:hypothetical protein n=1 Tax=Idiomarina sp. ST20R2A10 TaxID=3418369 RepID=UPI003EC72492